MSFIDNVIKDTQALSNPKSYISNVQYIGNGQEVSLRLSLINKDSCIGMVSVSPLFIKDLQQYTNFIGMICKSKEHKVYVQDLEKMFHVKLYKLFSTMFVNPSVILVKGMSDRTGYDMGTINKILGERDENN